ncbi:MAG: MBL fold metallo-hydrolase [Candidatus Pacearchaeota archaeon]|jgi:L-ascorbate metabolism protein UlaG (beta-lactamase superfamily)
MEIENVRIDFLGHAGFLIRTNGKSIAIDPYNLSLNVDHKVDIILITHSHYDHCSIKDIQQMSKRGTIIIAPPDAQSKVTRIRDIELKTLTLNQTFSTEDIKITSVPAYNIGKPFHEKSEEWFGYLIEFKDVIIYHAGDTDKIPEMAEIPKNSGGKILVSLLPVSGEYTMTAEEAAEAALVLKSSLAIPMHYAGGVAGTIEDAKRFINLCQQKGINAKILDRM